MTLYQFLNILEIIIMLSLGFTLSLIIEKYLKKQYGKEIENGRN